MIDRRRFLVASVVATALVLHRSAFADGNAEQEHDHGHGAAMHADSAQAQQDWGIVGDAEAVSRTIDIVMNDEMRFVPDHIEVRLGETIRFRHRNQGAVMHEMVIGTSATLAEHAEMMRRSANMAHGEPWMTHVEPGEHGEMIWQFNRPGKFEFACLIPGHFEAGMVGTIEVR